MLATVSAHFGSKDLAAGSEMSPTALNIRNKYTGWSLVNHLHDSKYEYFRSSSRTEHDSFLKIRQASSEMKESDFLKRLVMSNAVSCTGRVGKPIHYYEWIDFDARQLAEDIKTFTAHAMLSTGHDVILVAQSHLVIQVPMDEVDECLPEIEKAYCDALTQLLSTAFPSTNTPVDVYGYFVAPEITCKASPVWPTTFEEPSREQNESGVDTGSKMVKWPDISDWSNNADYEAVEPKEPETKLPKKRRRVRKNSKKGRKNP